MSRKATSTVAFFLEQNIQAEPDSAGSA